MESLAQLSTQAQGYQQASSATQVDPSQPENISHVLTSNQISIQQQGVLLAQLQQQVSTLSHQLSLQQKQQIEGLVSTSLTMMESHMMNRVDSRINEQLNLQLWPIRSVLSSLELSTLKEQRTLAAREMVVAGLPSGWDRSQKTRYAEDVLDKAGLYPSDVDQIYSSGPVVIVKLRDPAKRGTVLGYTNRNRQTVEGKRVQWRQQQTATDKNLQAPLKTAVTCLFEACKSDRAPGQLSLELDAGIFNWDELRFESEGDDKSRFPLIQLCYTRDPPVCGVYVKDTFASLVSEQWAAQWKFGERRTHNAPTSSLRSQLVQEPSNLFPYAIHIMPISKLRQDLYQAIMEKINATGDTNTKRREADTASEASMQPRQSVTRRPSPRERSRGTRQAPAASSRDQKWQNWSGWSWNERGWQEKTWRK